ncbi:hypothetical protein [Rhizorhabdus argentea]|uniref:hypothetical protein n=1 Tax=Rhizorhabdus argentea TaxID=1387174 RepID=UPI0030EB3960
MLGLVVGYQRVHRQPAILREQGIRFRAPAITQKGRLAAEYRGAEQRFADIIISGEHVMTRNRIVENRLFLAQLIIERKGTSLNFRVSKAG